MKTMFGNNRLLTLFPEYLFSWREETDMIT